jgi:hypothetical protein
MTSIIHQQILGVQSWKEITYWGTPTKSVEYQWPIWPSASRHTWDNGSAIYSEGRGTQFVMVANAPRTTDDSFDSINQGCPLARKQGLSPISRRDVHLSSPFFYLPLPSRHKVAHVLGGGGRFISPSQLSCYLRNLIISSWYVHWISHFALPLPPDSLSDECCLLLSEISLLFCQGGRLWPNWGTIRKFGRRDWGSLRKPTVKAISVPDELRTQPLADTSPECCSWTDPFGDVCSLLDSYRRFRETYCLRLHSQRVNRNWPSVLPVAVAGLYGIAWKDLQGNDRNVTWQYDLGIWLEALRQILKSISSHWVSGSTLIMNATYSSETSVNSISYYTLSLLWEHQTVGWCLWS